MIRTYKRKNNSVDAIQWTGDNIVDVLKFSGKGFKIGNDLVIITPLGNINCQPGMYVIKDNEDNLSVINEMDLINNYELI